MRKCLKPYLIGYLRNTQVRLQEQLLSFRYPQLLHILRESPPCPQFEKSAKCLLTHKCLLGYFLQANLPTAIFQYKTHYLIHASSISLIHRPLNG